jgi:cytidylate kinase
MPFPSIIAIDGPAASGKSTLAFHLASMIGYLYLDTGVMYRAVTLAVLKLKINLDDESAVTLLAQKVAIDVRSASQEDSRPYDVILDGVDVTWQIRQPEVEAHVSKVSAYSGVRQAMTIQQRNIAKRGKVVMVGRDIGTVVCPEAGLKIFLDASANERARRRFQELIARGESAEYDHILEAMRQRDAIDASRAVAPLKPASDAVIINSDGLDIDLVLAKVKILLGIKS